MVKYDSLGMMDLDLGLDRLLGPTFQMHRSMRDLQDAIMPSSRRTMLDMQEGLRAACPANLLDLAGFQSLHASIAPQERLFASMTAVTHVLRGQEFLSAMPTGAGLAAQLQDILGPRLAWSASPTLQLAQSLAGIMLEPTHLQWQEHLVQSLTPSFDLFANWSQGPVGLLAFMPQPELGASLTWVVAEDTRPASAALMAEGRYLPTIAIDTVVHCLLCGEELIQSGETLRWRGNRIRIDITVVPICAKCLHKAHDYADYILEAINELLHPPLRLVHTGGDSDGVPRGRGKLRLLTPDAEQGLGGLNDTDEE